MDTLYCKFVFMPATPLDIYRYTIVRQMDTSLLYIFCVEIIYSGIFVGFVGTELKTGGVCVCV